MDERYVVKTKICHFICCRLFPFMCACKWIYYLLLLYLRTYLSHNFYKWLLYFQSIFLFITWFLQLHILHQNDFNFSIGSGGFFTFISLFLFLDWILLGYLKNILFWQKNLVNFSCFWICKALCWIFLFPCFFWYWYRFLLFKFSISHFNFIMYGYFSSVFLNFFFFESLISGFLKLFSSRVMVTWLITVAARYIISFKRVKFGLKSCRRYSLA